MNVTETVLETVERREDEVRETERERKKERAIARKRGRGEKNQG